MAKQNWKGKLENSLAEQKIDWYIGEERKKKKKSMTEVKKPHYFHHKSKRRHHPRKTLFQPKASMIHLTFKHFPYTPTRHSQSAHLVWPMTLVRNSLPLPNHKLKPDSLKYGASSHCIMARYGHFQSGAMSLAQSHGTEDCIATLMKAECCLQAPLKKPCHRLCCITGQHCQNRVTARKHEHREEAQRGTQNLK